MANDARSRLEELRARARYEELKAKASGGSLPSGEDIINKNFPEDKRALEAGRAGIYSGASIGYARPSDYEQLKSEKPIQYGLGELIGGAVNPLTRVLGPGRTVLGGAGTGAALGAAYKPEGEDSVETRLKNAGIGGVAGGAIGGLSGVGESLAKKYDMYKRLLNPEGLSRDIKSKIDEVIGMAKSNYISPRAREVEQLAGQGKVTLGPAIVDQIKEALPGYGKKIQQLSQTNVPSPPSISYKTGPTGMIEKVVDRPGFKPEYGNVDIKGNRALKLRRLLDDMAEFKKQRALSDEARAKSEDIRSVADVLRGRIANINPRIKELQGQQSQALKTIGEISGKSVSPQSIVSKDTGDIASLMADLESYAGTKDLSNLGKDLRGGYSLMKPSQMPLTMQSQAPYAIARIGRKATGGAASKLEELVKAGLRPRDALLLQMLEENNAKNNSQGR